MSDDIVIRLRDIASLRGPMAGNIIPITCTEAANEIERLRALVTKRSRTATRLAEEIKAIRSGE